MNAKIQITKSLLYKGVEINKGEIINQAVVSIKNNRGVSSLFFMFDKDGTWVTVAAENTVLVK